MQRLRIEHPALKVKMLSPTAIASHPNIIKAHLPSRVDDKASLTVAHADALMSYNPCTRNRRNLEIQSIHTKRGAQRTDYKTFTSVKG